MATYVEIGGYQADLDYARITHINRPNIKFIRSFHIRSMDGGTKWLTIVNQKTLIGIYPNREAALGALIGCYLYVGGFVGSLNVSGPVIGPNNTITAGIGVSIDDLLGTGGGIIDGAENDLSIPVIVEGAGIGAVHVRIDGYDPNIYPNTGNQYYGFQVSALEDATTWPSITATTYLVTAPISAAAQIENQFTGLDMTLLENKAIRPVMVNENLGTYTIVKYGLPYVIDFETDTLVLGVEISGSEKIEAPTAVGGVAYANTTVTGAAPGKSVSLAYEWYREIPTLSSFTSTVLSIDSPVAPTFNGTPSASATDPTVEDEVKVLNYGASGNPVPDILFEWRVDGTVDNSSTTDTFDTSSLSGGEVLTCVVTASNGVSPDDTATISFGTVAAAGFDYELTGTATISSGGCGSQTTSVASTPTVADINRILMYGTGCGGNIQIEFTNPGSRDTFISNVPDGSDVVFSTTAGTFTAIGFTWQTYGSVARLNAASFSSFPASLSPTQVFSLGFTL